jgi:hypothetical protein
MLGEGTERNDKMPSIQEVPFPLSPYLPLLSSCHVVKLEEEEEGRGDKQSIIVILTGGLPSSKSRES